MTSNSPKEMSANSLLNILHIADPTLPIGGFSHSNGLETYVQQRIVKDADSAQLFIESMLKNNYKYNDSLTLRLAHEYASAHQMEELFGLDNEISALKSPREVREGSVKLGTRILKIYSQLITNELVTEFFNKVKAKEISGHYAVVYGLITSILGVDLSSSVNSFYYNAAVSMVTNAVKLVPLGQIDGQRILYGLHPLINLLTEETLVLDKAMLGVCNPALDIKCMQHERLYSRLYMS
ncbi:urease accessory protein UreF [Algoriphagus aquimarinus]|uniref:Urease accessory protein UreF n=1 Tax=Algoriphagus aquimarinus TaxID=237018 RepID=A0A1I1BJV3_9BACT|nr:urease accessory protein UreF [Algoriphagus aquimarinus]SFB50417.1 urease accessory protein [Algoriphagus aquimarinus]